MPACPRIAGFPPNTVCQTRWLMSAAPEASPAFSSSGVKVRPITGWSTLHGFVTLTHGGRLKDFMIEPLSHEELVEAILDKTLVTA